MPEYVQCPMCGGQCVPKDEAIESIHIPIPAWSGKSAHVYRHGNWIILSGENNEGIKSEIMLPRSLAQWLSETMIRLAACCKECCSLSVIPLDRDR